MELTRRDAIAALAASGVAVGIGARSLDSGADDDSNGNGGGESATGGRRELSAHDRETVIAVAEVVYPADVTGIETFVATYLGGRSADDPDHVAGIVEAVATLDDLGDQWYEGDFLDLDSETRDRLLREVGADVADPDPDGLPGARIRYYLVNELLYALYASPTGGELVGIENPQGYPGGQVSYRRGPDRE